MGTRRRQHRYSWEAVGATWGRQRIGIGHLVQNSQFNSFLLQYFLCIRHRPALMLRSLLGLCSS
jgi:hypothetical protein